MARAAGRQDQDRCRGEDQDYPDALDDTGQNQYRSVAREGAATARRRDQHKARHDRAAMTEAVGKRTHCRSKADADQTDHGRNDPRGNQPERQVFAQCRKRGRHLANLKNGHRAREGREPDQAPARRRRHWVSFQWNLLRLRAVSYDCATISSLTVA